MSDGRTALVTGGAGGIGAAVCERLAAEGMRVAIADLPEREAEGRSVASHAGGGFTGVDVADPGSVAACFREAGPVDALDNCAGVTRAGVPVWDTDDGLWSTSLAVNLSGSFHCLRAAVPAMRERGWGRIVNVASGLATRGVEGSAAYAASKAGVCGLTRAAAADLAADGITVNAVSPGYVKTPMTASFPPELRERRLAEIGRGRFAEPREVAGVVAFLCSDEAGYLTGATIDVTGGFRIQ